MSAEDIDLSALGAYLHAELPQIGAVEGLEKFSGGQSNPTFLLRTSNGEYVLRRQPPGELLKSAHAVDREFRVIAALAGSDVPVPRAIHLCTDCDVIGSLFFLMSHEAGRIFWDPTLPQLERSERGAIYAEMNRVLAA